MPSDRLLNQVSVVTLLEVLRRRKFYILVPLLLLAAGFTVYALRLPPVYRAQVLVSVESSAPHYVGGTDPATVRQQLQTIRGLLFSRSLLEQVIAEFNLYGEGQTELNPKALEDIESRLRLQLEGEDAFFIGFEGPDRHQVTNVSNRLAELFIQRTSAVRQKNLHETAGFLQGEVESLRKKLDEREQEINGYKRRAAQALPEYLPTNLKLLETLHAQLQAKRDGIGDEEAERTALLEEMKQLGRVPQHEEPEEKKSAAQQKLEESKLKLEQLQARYTEQHPEVARARREIAELEKTVQTEMQTDGKTRSRPQSYPAEARRLQLEAKLTGTEQRLKSYRAEEKKIASQLAVYEQRAGSTPQHESVLAELERDLDITRSQYQALLQRQNAAQLAERLESSSNGVIFRILEPARLPLAPYAPRRYRIILLGLLAGLGAGLGLVFLVEQLDTSFRSIDELQRFTSLPVIAAIPSIPSTGKGQNSRAVGKTLQRLRREIAQKGNNVSLNPSLSIASEQYRVLALRTQLMSGDGSSRVLLITSAGGGEGKTTTAINLSVALSEAVEGPVLLLDCDLRRPLVHHYLDLQPGLGASDLLLKPGGDIDGYLQRVRNLFVIAGGSRLTNPVAVLASAGARGVLTRLRQRFKYIVIDSPPIVPAVDSHILAGVADGVLCVVRSRQTRRELFQRAIESFEVSNLLGVVLNDVDFTHTRYAYAYEYYQRNYARREELEEAEA